MSVLSLREQGRRALLVGDLDGACTAFEGFLRLSPSDAECWFLLGSSRHRMQDLGAAQEAFFRATKLDSSHLQSRLALASVCLAQGDTKVAAEACLEATKIAPGNPDALFSLGVAYEANSEDESALKAYDCALQLEPDHVGALRNRRALLMRVGRFDEAIAQSRIAVIKLPFSVEAQFSLGESLTAAGVFSEAARVFGCAASIDPMSARVALHHGFALAQVEQFAEAQKKLDLAARLDKSLVREYRTSIFGNEQGDASMASARLDARVLFLLRHFERIERCDWKERDYFVARFSALICESGPPLIEQALAFRAMAMGLAAPLQRQLASQIASGIEALLPDAVQIPFYSDHMGRAHPRIRIGYLSADFRYHPVALLLGNLFSLHDRNRFEVFGYSIGENDGSDQRETITACCDVFVDMAGVDDDSAARQIAADSIDVLFDLTGYLDQARPGILARRPAPVQISWLGYLATSGARWIDYVVADDFSLPDGLSCDFSEAVIRLKGSAPWASESDVVSSSEALNRPEHGLPKDGIVLCCMNAHYKIDPQVFSVWMRLLSANDSAVLWLLDGSKEAVAALREWALQHGVDPVRLIFAPKVLRAKHLERLYLADLALDTPQCNGGTTTTDALSVGVPVLACAGQTYMQRVSSAILRAVGLGDLIAKDLAEYEEHAQFLLSHVENLRAIRQRIVSAKTIYPVFSANRWLRQFETGILRVWELHGAGLSPRIVEVEE